MNFVRAFHNDLSIQWLCRDAYVVRKFLQGLIDCAVKAVELGLPMGQHSVVCGHRVTETGC